MHKAVDLTVRWILSLLSIGSLDQSGGMRTTSLVMAMADRLSSQGVLSQDCDQIRSSLQLIEASRS